MYDWFSRISITGWTAFKLECYTYWHREGINDCHGSTARLDAGITRHALILGTLTGETKLNGWLGLERCPNDGLYLDTLSYPWGLHLLLHTSRSLRWLLSMALTHPNFLPTRTWMINCDCEISFRQPSLWQWPAFLSLCSKYGFSLCFLTLSSSGWPFRPVRLVAPLSWIKCAIIVMDHPSKNI